MFKKPVTTLAFAILLAAIIFILAIFIFPADTSAKADIKHTEIAKSLLQVCVTVVIGGILKMIIDSYQSKQKEIEEGNLRTAENEKARRNFINETELKLRKIVDDIELSRTLIKAHGSAKTYGERMCGAIIPSITGLFDMKRSVKKSVAFEVNLLARFRVSVHFMIAYLKFLADEYQAHYLEISLDQYAYECMREAYKKAIMNSSALMPADAEKINEDYKCRLLESSKKTTDKIFELTRMKDFLGNNETGVNYYKLFLNHFDVCKSILKEQPVHEIKDKYYLQLVADFEGAKHNDETNYVAAIMHHYKLIEEQ